MLDTKIKKYIVSCFKEELEQQFEIKPELFLDDE